MMSRVVVKKMHIAKIYLSVRARFIIKLSNPLANYSNPLKTIIIFRCDPLSEWKSWNETDSVSHTMIDVWYEKKGQSFVFQWKMLGIKAISCNRDSSVMIRQLTCLFSPEDSSSQETTTRKSFYFQIVFSFGCFSSIRSLPSLVMCVCVCKKTEDWRRGQRKGSFAGVLCHCKTQIGRTLKMFFNILRSPMSQKFTEHPWHQPNCVSTLPKYYFTIFSYSNSATFLLMC